MQTLFENLIEFFGITPLPAYTTVSDILVWMFSVCIMTGLVIFVFKIIIGMVKLINHGTRY